MTLYLLLLIPFLVPLGFKILFHSTITWAEWLLHTIVAIALVVLSWHFVVNSSIGDVNYVNGHVIQKYKEKVSCSHSYSCNCREVCSGSGNSRSCHTHCDTCYDHSYDFDWVVNSTVNLFRIDRIDRQGVKEPPRFTKVSVGDPVSSARTYSNPIKAAPSSIFNRTTSPAELRKEFPSLPSYPSGIYDYHYLDRFIADDVPADSKQWNKAIQELNSRLAHKHVTEKGFATAATANIIVVVTSNADMRYAKALEALWLGGRKNDTVIVIGAPNYPQVEWVKAFGWLQDTYPLISIEQTITNHKVLEIAHLTETVEKELMNSFHLQDMNDFKYLLENPEISMPLIGLQVLLALLFSIGIAIIMHKNDIFDAERKSKQNFRYRRL